MKETITSPTTGKTYAPGRGVVRIVNYKQAAAYITYGAELLDIYASRDHETHTPLLVYIFDRKATEDLYDKWCNHLLK